MFEKVRRALRVIRLAVRAPTEAAEQVLAALLDLAPSGVEQVEGEGFVEYAVYGAPGELPELPEGEAEVGGVLVTVSGTEVPDDWAERWKRFHSPVLVGGRLWVRPPWEEAAVRPGAIDLVIDPGRAFGTGAHPTTRLCLELLLDLELRGARSATWAADRACCRSRPRSWASGRSRRWTPTAWRWTPPCGNARDNGVALDEVRRADLRREAAPAADTVAANLMRPLLLRVAELMGEPPRGAHRVRAAGARGRRGGRGVRGAARDAAV